MEKTHDIMKPRCSKQICQSVGPLLYFLGSTVFLNGMYTVRRFFSGTCVCSTNENVIV